MLVNRLRLELSLLFDLFDLECLECFECLDHLLVLEILSVLEYLADLKLFFDQEFELLIELLVFFEFEDRLQVVHCYVR